MPYVSTTSPAVTDRAPATSRLRHQDPSGRAALTTRIVRSAEISPIGTLMNKIQRQLKPCVSTPPRMEPEAPPTPPIAPHAPTALLRSPPSVKVLVMIESEAGATTAPPTPWSARAATR